ncbi:hypothetical protein ACX0KM_12895 [Pseudomonas promysalinigenes]
MVDDIEFFYKNAPITDPDVKTLLMHSTPSDTFGEDYVYAPFTHRVTIYDGKISWEMHSPFYLPEHGQQKPSQQTEHLRPPKQGEKGVVVLKGIIGQPAYDIEGPLAETLLRLGTGSVFQEDGKQFQIIARQIMVYPPEYASLAVIVRPLS